MTRPQIGVISPSFIVRDVDETKVAGLSTFSAMVAEGYRRLDT